MSRDYFNDKVRGKHTEVGSETAERASGERKVDSEMEPEKPKRTKFRPRKFASSRNGVEAKLGHLRIEHFAKCPRFRGQGGSINYHQVPSDYIRFRHGGSWRFKVVTSSDRCGKSGCDKSHGELQEVCNPGQKTTGEEPSEPSVIVSAIPFPDAPDGSGKLCFGSGARELRQGQGS